MKADKEEWHRGTHQSIQATGEGSRPINETYLDITRKKRTEEMEMW